MRKLAGKHGHLKNENYRIKTLFYKSAVFCPNSFFYSGILILFGSIEFELCD